MQIQCSCCGAKKNFRYSVGAVLDEVIGMGWNSYGSALYCSECSTTWHCRNGSDKPLAGRENTIAVIDALHEREPGGERESEWIGYTTSAYKNQDEFGEPVFVEKKFFRCKRCRTGSAVQSDFCPECGSRMKKERYGREDNG